MRARLPTRVPVHAVNGCSPAAADELATYCTPGNTRVMLGSSGAGKSTLTNTLAGATVQATGALSEGDSRGRHTTTARTLHCLPGGACIVDTPGLRTLALDIDAGDLNAGFSEIAALAQQCRFRYCRHESTPGCAVRAAADRLANCRRLGREIRRGTMTPPDRRRQRAEWKLRQRAAAERMRSKRG